MVAAAGKFLKLRPLKPFKSLYFSRLLHASVRFLSTYFSAFLTKSNFFTPRSSLRMGYCRQPTRTSVRPYVRPKNF